MGSARLNVPTNADNPLDVLEGMAYSKEWHFDRPSSEEMAVDMPGRWCDLSLYFSWNAEISAIHFSCALDLRVPAEKRGAVHELLALINEKTWMGHFGLWEDCGVAMFRHTLPLRGTLGASMEQLEDMVDVAMDECERFYPAFQFVIWGGRSPREAVEASLIDTVGEA